LSKVGLTISFNEKMDETTELCKYSVPNHHYLESWGDAEPRTGYVSFIQPTIFPLFKTRPFQTSLLKWSGNNTDYETYFRNFWVTRLGSQQAFDRVLQDGLSANGRAVEAVQPIGAIGSTVAQAAGQNPAQAVTDSLPAPAAAGAIAQTPASPAAPVVTSSGPFNGGGITAAAAAIAGTRPSGKDEVVLYQNVAMGTGKQAGNPWLLELPDPITRATWDNYAMISTAKAKELGIDYTTTEYEYYNDKPVIDVTVNNITHKLPVLVIPGMDPKTIAIAVGYGRSEKFAKATHGVGKNVYPFARFNGTTIVYHNDATTSAKADGTYTIAQVQKHDSYEGRTEVVKETTLATFKQRPNDFKAWREELHKDYAPTTGDYRKEGTLYGDHVQPGPKWGMSIDMNLCIGCHACVVACHTENNVPVVGKNEVARYHDMHWLRIDRYFVSNETNPDKLETVVFQPMLCQHCDNAPCENVCPVAATMHSSEGINQMAYNRCIGTRYCANNCPYKVRRFNWADYTGASTHGVNGPDGGVGKLNDAVHQMNDELTRMVLNPDVVTRSRGVMEKCTFCVQRTQAGKLKAKMENRDLGGNEIQSACAQACPTSAIVFGNVNDPSSTVAQIRKNNTQRLFYVLEQIHTLPNVSYLAKIRNSPQILPGENEGQHAREQHQESVTPHHEPAKDH
ncbi:MAG TPA: 4Fe-4S dicluster domain-containing protein, partial [Flavisolibacter sp.]|nr:4Fe-4S dicluster domain-containing protein [Flavisolibacter sp.]